MPTFRDVFARLERERIDVGTEFLNLLRIAICHFEHANGQVELASLTADHVRTMMRDLANRGRALSTVNNYRRYVLLLWQAARDMKFDAPTVPRSDVRRLKTIDRLPTAWRSDEMALLLTACDDVQKYQHWGSSHDRALLMTCYDTSLRVGALVKSKFNQLDVRRCSLFVPGDKQKGKADTYQPLHPDTCAMLVGLDRPFGDDRLFPIPFHRRNLFRRMGKILKAAGLPQTRRDKFHRIRRTSYTLVAKEFGIAAASEHAAHKGDLSRYYLDKSMLDRPNPLDALPRPKAG